MNIGIIITLPRHDSVTEYISQFSVEIIGADGTAVYQGNIHKISGKNSHKEFTK